MTQKLRIYTRKLFMNVSRHNAKVSQIYANVTLYITQKFRAYLRILRVTTQKFCIVTRKLHVYLRKLNNVKGSRLFVKLSRINVNIEHLYRQGVAFLSPPLPKVRYHAKVQRFFASITHYAKSRDHSRTLTLRVITQKFHE